MSRSPASQDKTRISHGTSQRSDMFRLTSTNDLYSTSSQSSWPLIISLGNGRPRQRHDRDVFRRLQGELIREGNVVSSIPRQLSADLHADALHLFLSNTVMSCGGSRISPGHFTMLAGLADSPAEHDSLPAATAAVALSSYARRFHQPDAEIQALYQYNLAVGKLRNTNIASRSNTLSTIAAIVMLGMYEVRRQRPSAQYVWIVLLHANKSVVFKLVSARPDRNPGWAAHLDGLIAVLKMTLEPRDLSTAGHDLQVLIVGSKPSPGW
jgi:hypothetical protein